MAGSDKSALFIDGANLHYTARALGFEVDFRRLLAEFETECVLLRAYYYTTTDESTDLQSIRPLTDWLSYNGFHVKTKPRTEFDDREGRRRFKRNIGVELSVDALEVAKYVGHIVLFFRRCRFLFSDRGCPAPWTNCYHRIQCSNKAGDGC